MPKNISKIILATLLSSAAYVGAAPLNISEPPDFPAIGVNIGTLDVGANVISGTWSGTPVQPVDLNTDNFNVTLLSGMQIDSITIAFSLLNGEVANTGITSPLNNFLFGGGAAGTVTGPLTELGEYKVELNAGVIFDTTAWAVTFNVSQPRVNDVPEPATPALLGAALAGLLLAKRRRK